MPRTTTYGSEARSPSNEVTAGTICSSADPWPGTRTQPRGDVQAGIVAVSDPSPAATVAATGRVPRSQPPDGPGRRNSSSTCTLPVKPVPVMAYTAGGIVTSIDWPAFADGSPATAGVPPAATDAIAIPGSTVTVAFVARSGSSEDAARTYASPAGGRLGAV